jgi:glycosyltransferase involved in cell wall biosynthesis
LQHMMISILIATKDRPHYLKACLTSLLKSTYRNFQVIILDQSTTTQTQQCVNSFHTNKLHYHKQKETGKSKAINWGVAHANGDIISLTDDDCLVDPSWVGSINAYFRDHHGVSGVFGKTLPYEPQKHPHMMCPATFSKDTETIVSDPSTIFYLTLGQGNNVSYRKKMFQEIGGMNERFGPGAIIPTAEDCNLLYRALMRGKTLAYSPLVRLYHNRWISYRKERMTQMYYTIGTGAVVSHSLIHFHDLRILHLLFYRFNEHILQKIFSLFRLLIHGKMRTLWYQKSDIFFVIMHTIAFCYGILLGAVI